MFDLPLRDIKEIVLGWFCAPFADVHPNKLTLMSALIGVFCAYFAALKQYNIALACWALNRILDGLDGTVARRFNKQRCALNTLTEECSVQLMNMELVCLLILICCSAI